MSYLVHHGILGQKWGVRRYQNKDGTYTAAGKKHRKTLDTVRKYEKSGDASTKDFEKKTAGLSIMTMHSGDKFRSGLISGHDFDWQEVDKFYDDYVPDSIISGVTFKHVIADPHENEEHDHFRITSNDLKTCNPNFGLPGTTYNCAKCTAALEMRLRGLDVHAGRQTDPSTMDAMEFWFPGAKRVDYAPDSVQSALTSYGPETSGMIGITYPNGMGGHAVHWTNDSDGNFEIQDGQTGERFSSFKQMSDEYGVDPLASVVTYRLDECAWDMKASASDSVIRNDTTSGKEGTLNVRNRVSGELVNTW